LEDLCNILFELSNEDRMRIIHRLSRDASNVTTLSRKLDLTTQESSRHLSRLINVGLIKKDVDGLHLDFFGELILKQLEGLKFSSKHQSYFASHSLSEIPGEFIARIGELSDSNLVDNVMTSFHNVERLIKEAEEYILEMTDRYIMSTFPLLRDSFEREVRLRNIQRTEFLSQPMYSEIDPEVTEELKRLSPRLWEERYLDKLPFFLYMSEKEVASIGFPTNGKLDYIGFSSKDKKVHKWCHDLFQHFWKLTERKRKQ
jgi:predicted transcriptional regulator